MERFEQRRTQNRLIIRMSREAFSAEILDSLREREDAAFLLLPDAAADGEQMELSFSLDGYRSLNEASDELENDALVRALKQLTEAVSALPGLGLDITQVLTATDQVMLGKDGIRLLCLCCQPSDGERATRKALIQQIRQLVMGREGLGNLNDILSNPFCTLEALRSRLQKMPENSGTETPQEAAAKPAAYPRRAEAEPVSPKPAVKEKEPLPEAPAAEPGEDTPSVSRPFRPEFFTPMNMKPTEPAKETAAEKPFQPAAPEASPPVRESWNSDQPFIPMMAGSAAEKLKAPFSAMEPAPRSRRAERAGAGEADQREAVRPAAAQPRPVRGAMNEMTVDEPVPDRREPRRTGLDETTVDDSDSGYRSVRTGSLDEPTVGEPGTMPESGRTTRKKAGKKETGREKPAPAAEAPKKETPPKTGPAKPVRTQGNPPPKAARDPKKAFWQSMAMLAGYTAGAALLAILAGAFLGTVGIILILLAAAIGLAFLFSRGYLTLRWPKKQEPAMEQPVAPNVGEVFTVRLRLISQNLATHQEVIIRENNQIIGSDPAVCPSPLKYRGISRRHCRISCKRTGGHEEYFITDLGSTNGTKLNGELLEPDMDYSLKLGDHVTLAGRYDFKISSDAY